MARRQVFAGSAVALGVVAGVGLWLALSTPEAQVLAARVRALGPAGPVVLLALFVVQCVIAPIPSEPIMMAAGFVYGPAMAFALAWIGVGLGAAACFLIARGWGRVAAARLVSASRLEAFERMVLARGTAMTFAGLLAIRLVAFTSFDVLSYACGLLRIPFGWFLLATAIGSVPKVLAFTYAGAMAGERPGWLDGMILAGTVGILLVVPWLARRWTASVRSTPAAS